MRFTQFLRGTASLVVLSGLAAGVTAGAAVAQSKPEAKITSVEEIVVTAQKREQNLQDVPVTVTSLPAQLLQNAGVHDIKDMTVLTPGLTVTSTSNEAITTARIRGVGTVGDNPGLESSVGVVIDGVYRPRNGVGFGDLGEMQRVEVLKGPQGTLFGKNTSAGVISVITKAPQFTFGAEGELTAGNFGEKGGSASITGPIGSDHTLAGRFYFADRQRDGFYKINTAGGPRTDTDDQTKNYWTARGQLLYQPTDKLSLRAIADYTRRDERCCAAVQIRSGPTAALVNALAAGGQGVTPAVTGGSFGPAPGYQMLPYTRTAFSNQGTSQKITDKGISLEANYDMDGARLTSITGVRNWGTRNAQDIDYSGMDLLYRLDDGGNQTDFKDFSEEVRAAGKIGRLDWLVGGFWAAEELNAGVNYYFGTAYNNYVSLLLTTTAPGGPYTGRIGCFTPNNAQGGFNATCTVTGAGAVGALFPTGKGVQDNYTQHDHTIALFTNENFAVTDALTLTAGLRYTRDDKTLGSSYLNLGTNGAACGGALNNQSNASPAARTPAAALGALCLPWANPLFSGLNTTQKKNEADWSGTLKGAYRWSPDVMTYVSYARGYKAGGFNLDRIQSSTGLPNGATGVTPVTDTSFPAETVTSWEAGAKTTWAGGKVLLNATWFDQKFEHFQLNTFLGTSFVVESIPQVTSKGFDADFIWFTPMDGLTLQGGITYADTKYNSFAATDLIASGHFPNLSLLPGNHVSFAPKWSDSISASYDHDMGGNMRFLASLSAKYTSQYSTKSDLLPAGDQKAMTLMNGRVGFGAADHSWTVEAWGQNLTNEKYYQVAFNAPLQGTAFQSTVQPSGNYYNPALDTQTYDAFLGQPRAYGVTLRVRY